MSHLQVVLSCVVVSGSLVLGAPAALAAEDWSENQVSRLPKSERPIRLFNGRDFSGWEGQTEKYFVVEDGVIVARNGRDNAPAASTYLVTKSKYRNFRLIFEAKLVTSEMHSGISLWGRTVEKANDPFSYQGHLVMFPSNYGYWDLYRRNSIYKDRDGVARRAGKQHDWNRMEILAIGNRIRHVINGTLAADWSDPRPELCQPGPIGLQLHSNRVAQEVHFRGLILTADPEDNLVTVAKPADREPTHRLTAASAYYRSGPQQGRPADGTLPAGTLVTVLDNAGSYSLVRSASGRQGYVSTAALAPVTPDQAVRLRRELESAVKANNAFACDLYRELSGVRKDNLFFSPASISTALTMTYAGARGETRQQMAQALRIDRQDGQLHSAYGRLHALLNTSEPDVALSSASRLWGQRGYDFVKDFLALTRESYGAELGQVDFANNTAQARQAINAWIAEQTRDKIQDLLPAGSVDTLTRLVLTNAIYFKGNWSSQFNPRTTRQRPFHVVGERQVMASFMSQSHRFGYAETPQLQVLEMPYGKQADTSMLVLLPRDRGGLQQLEADLNLKSLTAWTGSLRKVQVQVSLPRFRLNSEFNLNDSLQALGMLAAFDPASADFSGISSANDLYMTAAIHKAFVDVNEEGTEAAAATGVVLGVRSAVRRIVFQADHPFLFLIRDNRSGAILFLGRVVNPA